MTTYKLIALDECSDAVRKVFSVIKTSGGKPFLPESATCCLYTAWTAQFAFVSSALVRIDGSLLSSSVDVGKACTNRDLALLDRRVRDGCKHITRFLHACEGIEASDVLDFKAEVVAAVEALEKAAVAVRSAVNAYWEGAANAAVV